VEQDEINILGLLDQVEARDLANIGPMESTAGPAPRQARSGDRLKVFNVH
jgi:hypothetical protein